MSLSKIRIFSLFLVAFTIGNAVAPLSAEAATKKLDLYNPKKRYADEKMVITNPESKCATKAAKEKHLTNLDRAIEEGLVFGVNSSTEGELGNAYRRYLDALDIVWDAMNEPYCGFGAFGVKAASRSYDKSVGRIHDRFLSAMKKLGVTAHVAKPKAVAVKEVTTNMAKSTKAPSL